MEKLKCEICDLEVDNNLTALHTHIESHIGNYEEEAELEGEDIDIWVLSYFNSY